ncbi:uncharacterized protein LOC100679859 [Nasonia vitripennis]|uniref:Uncharacterized protein n=1 Tax=Nasonia vitripennis TaxID=7425 RepID=A0A7M7IXP5_NASVI|nr:uncharacterized protein LOC100679859 [Nasonia vitripennis]
MHACIKFVHDNNKYHCVLVSHIFYKKNDVQYITPLHLLDYDSTHKYYILHEKNQRYPGYIVCLGESLEEVQRKALDKPKRLIFPKKFTSSEDEKKIEGDDSRNPETNPIKLKVSKKMAQKENSVRVIEKFKSQFLIRNRTNLTLANDRVNENIGSNNRDLTRTNYNSNLRLNDDSHDRETTLINSTDNQINENYNSKLLRANVVIHLVDCVKSSPHVTKEITKVSNRKARKSCSNSISPTQLERHKNVSNPGYRKDIIPPNEEPPYETHPNTASTSIQEPMDSPRLSPPFGMLPDLSTNQKVPVNHTLQSASPPPMLSDVASTSKEVSEHSPASTPPSVPENLFPLAGQTFSRSLSPASNTNLTSSSSSLHLQQFRDRFKRLREATPAIEPSQCATPRSSRRSPQTRNGSERQTLCSENQEHNLTDPRSPSVQSSIRETHSILSDNGAANIPCHYLYTYKKQLYKNYKKRKIDMRQQHEEVLKRYEEMDGEMVYLGEGIQVGIKSWRISKRKKYTCFLRDIGGYLWKKHQLPTRCLDLSKTKKVLPEGYQYKLCSPRKVDLYLSLYDDYLKENRKYKNMSDDERDIMIKNSTEVLTSLIRDERDAFIKKNIL